ncbi:MAG: hypothetical protein R3A47_10680 [Polyangiales bacterium]
MTEAPDTSVLLEHADAAMRVGSLEKYEEASKFFGGSGRQRAPNAGSLYVVERCPRARSATSTRFGLE